MLNLDFIANGRATGPVANTLLACDFNVHSLRPFIGNDGRHYITVEENGKLRAVPISNVAATLRKDDWKLLDDAIVLAAKPRLRFVGDLRAAGLTFTIPNGMAKTVLETETQSDINDASISMDALREGVDYRPHFELTNLPLPIIHKDFHLSARQIAASRNGGSPLDTTMAELAARKVAEEAEKLALGRLSTYTYGGGIIYGATNYPSRMTRTITTPTFADGQGAQLLADVLAMRQQSQNAYHYGPWMLYNSPNWDQVLDDDFKSGSDVTIRNRVKQLEGISDMKTLDYLQNYDMLLVQMTSDVIREVIGMDITTVQWETVGGLKVNFKIMAILVPQLRADFNGNTGIVHGSV